MPARARFSNDGTVPGMIRWRRGEVRQVLPSWPGVVLCVVSIDARRNGGGGVFTGCRALAYTDLVGAPEMGDTVLLDTGALDLELGTGGYAFVVALPDRLPAGREGLAHLVKVRCTPL